MLLLKLVGTNRQSVPLVHRLVQLIVHTFHLGTGFPKVAMRPLEFAAKRTKLEAQTIGFGLP
jgi:hypothetical protein